MTKPLPNLTFERAGVSPHLLGAGSPIPAVQAALLAHNYDLYVFAKRAGVSVEECAKTATRSFGEIVRLYAQDPSANWFVLAGGGESGVHVLWFPRPRDRLLLTNDFGIELPPTLTISLPDARGETLLFRAWSSDPALPTNSITGTRACVNGTRASVQPWTSLPGSVADRPQGGRYVWSRHRAPPTQLARLPREWIWGLAGASLSAVERDEFDPRQCGRWRIADDANDPFSEDEDAA
jgi:hypothetical protein